jgi:hypothetical protein
MTVADVAKAFGIPAAEIYEGLKLPGDTPRTNSSRRSCAPTT